jgi:phage terminase large subunit-like protein
MMKELERRASRTRLYRYTPYPKQLEFHGNGASHRERLLMAANQVGKTFCGATETAMHLTGFYPEWWPGKRFDRAVRAWAGSKTTEVTRDGVQRYLVGDPRDKDKWGTGSVPGDLLARTITRQGVADSLDGIVVKHASGDNSTLGFKSYDQGREKWQGETLDFVWFDEEPPFDIYMEGLTRTNATGGIAFITFTPLLGMSEVVRMFLNEGGHDAQRNADDD